MLKENRNKYLGIVVLSLLFFVIIKFISQRDDDNVSPIAIVDENNISLQLAPSTCIDCHGNMEGMSPYHKDIGCVACHKGDNEEINKDSSHAGMFSIPGNMSDADQTCGICHPQALSDIKSSMMSTNSGIISIDRYIFGEIDSPNELTHIHDLKHSSADEHLRNLCSHCHLGNEKTESGAINELSRGGGCNACHLNYSDEAERGHQSFIQDSTLAIHHPSLDLNVTDKHCFGCHSRSGRISTNYEGWHETLLSADSISKEDGYRILEDDRVFRYVAEDVHHTIGLQCIDCHNYEDVMGDGQLHAHEEEAVKISCEDCHFSETPSTLLFENLEFTHKRILAMRNYGNEEQRILMTKKDSTPILNSYLDEENNAFLIRKADREIFALNAPSESCNRDAGHKNISCSACHSNWAPQCIGCHTNYDPKAQGYDLYEGEYKDGSWIEFAAEFLADAPVLGMRSTKDKKEVQPAIPGMIMTLDQSAFSKKYSGDAESFHRLFSPVAPHTTSAEGRSCASCHTNPTAIGYGRGRLTFISNTPSPYWEFEAEYENLRDGIPADAWIAFLSEPDSERFSTRLDFKPFSLEEQKKILTIGACLSCHNENSATMKNSLRIPFSEYRKEMSSKCKVPIFK